MSIPQNIRVSVALMAALCLTLSAVPVRADDVEISLENALTQFYAHNYDILISRFEIDKTQADLVGAKLLPNPTFTFNKTGIQTANFPADGDNAQLQFRLDQLFELGGKRGLRTGIAQESLDAAKLTHRDTIRTLLTGFYTLLYNLKLDLLNLEQAQDEMKRFDRTLEIAGKRFSAGHLSQVDYTKIRIARIDLENSLLTQENQFKNDAEQLGFMIGRDGKIKPLIATRDTFPAYQEADLIGIANENRSDLLALLKQLKSAEYNTALSKAGRIPDITVGAEYDTYGRQNTPAVGFGFNFSLPLFNRNQGEIARRDSEYRQLALQIEKQKRQIVVDIRQAINNFTTAHAVFDAYKARRGEVDELLGRSEKAFSLGGVTALDLLDTQKTHRDFMAKYNQALIQSNLNDALIKVVTGEIK